MSAKKRLRELRTECCDWDAVIASFTTHGVSKRDAELGILDLVDAGLVRVTPRRGKPTTFELAIPEWLHDKK
jgi:hypothetical protein